MKINEYIEQVYRDAEEQMMETYDVYTWFEMWEDLCGSGTVTGRECGRYRGMDEDQAADCAKDLVWDRNFREAFYVDMGCDILDDNAYDPQGFDMDVRMFCLYRLQSFLRDRYQQMVIFGEVAHVDLPAKYLM